ncbi:MAG: FHA domain-containing protein [Chloroflexi bacterium]|nr:FHA domain-containing protein [Chloroflexota bacterium]
MSKIAVHLIDMAGHQSSLPLPSEKPLAVLIPAIVTLLDLTEVDFRGEPLSYRLFSPRLQRVLSSNGTLYTNGILEQDSLRVVPAPASDDLELELLDSPEPGTHLPLPRQPRITVGRGSDNDIVIRHPSISRYHGEFIWQEGIHIYHDLNSANGSYINNQFVSEPMPISTGSIIYLGESIRLIYQEAPETIDSEPGARLEGPTGLDSKMITSLNPLPRGIVFISHDHDQTPVVSKLVDQLHDANYHIFWEKEIPTGSNPTEAVNNALQLADAMVAILTPEAVESPHLMEQWHTFILLRKPMVTVLYTPCAIPALFDNFPLVEFQGDFHRLAKDIADALNLILG